MDFSFFINDNKSGYKTQEKWVLKNQPDLYKKIIDYTSKLNIELSFKEKIYFYFHKMDKRPSCKTCGSEIKFRNRFDKAYGEFCSLKCINDNKDEMIERQKKTFQLKYGVDFYPQHNEFIKKQKKTKLERYGDENYNNIEKVKKTKLTRYNDENYSNHEKGKITSLNRYDSENYATSNSYKNRIIQNYKNLYPRINFIDVGKHDVKILCQTCNQESTITKQLVYERSKINQDVCLVCNPLGQSNRSSHEEEVSLFLKSINVEHECSNRSLVKKEIDILVSSKNLCIEINGLYWHSELFVPSNYHLDKTIKCQEKDLDLIHIFEDEWIYKKEIVKSIIKNRLGITENKIYARKCVIKEVNHKTAEIFLNENHIQGKVNSKVRLGLYYGDKLVSMMTFSKGRVLMGGKSHEWELNRFVNLIDTNVIGGADRLFKYFLKNYNPKMVISYSDIRLFNGGMYNQLGFIKKSQSKPNYWYIKNGLRYHRFNYRKSILVKEGFDPKMTEKEIMFSRKIYRIYDCGNIRWEYIQ